MVKIYHYFIIATWHFHLIVLKKVLLYLTFYEENNITRICVNNGFYTLNNLQKQQHKIIKKKIFLRTFQYSSPWQKNEPCDQTTTCLQRRVT